MPTRSTASSSPLTADVGTGKIDVRGAAARLLGETEISDEAVEGALLQELEPGIRVSKYYSQNGKFLLQTQSI